MRDAKAFFDNYDTYVRGKKWGVAYHERRMVRGNLALSNIKSKLGGKK